MITDVLKNSVEEDLKEIKKCKLDILILQRKNDELCHQNNAEIQKLNTVIENRLAQAEESLKQSGERKIDTSAGWVSFRSMPDSWEYDDAEILEWCKHNNMPYYHMVEIIEKMKLKKAIQEGNLNLEEIPGIEVTPQEPKFNYKLNGGGELL